ncbi:NAD(P)-dependent oxidoreductase [Paenibacillus sp. 7124]|uniref:NAD(P)-dependent oxidoreductase n=1 Tax=Paenibacillus apii TaxID=1850370 RepID=A0A6M1PJD9_9BACL|nr:NAD(P)-dependent oxidoreductase [Paenibacillus apii]NGM83687.1 NAD(P)-dependent oxidoreductase [Paenibacillus apii]NJJ41208.1 NAD(P)-dependent oxidoreductase [Paenibacillus apii]
MTKIAWIGTGHMGLPMARNLIKAGIGLHVYNRTAERAQPLGKDGAVIRRTLAEAAEGADFIFLMLTKGDAVKDVLAGEEGILAHLKPNAYIVNMSTIGPEEAKEFARLTGEARGIYVDAPVSGSVGPAVQAQLVILAGGDRDALEACRPYLDKLGKAVIHFGDVGAGSYAKLAINLLLGVTAQGVGEALLFAEKSGLDRELVLRMISESAVSTKLFEGKKEMYVKDEYPSAFMISLVAKDLGLLTDEARRAGLNLPLAEAAGKTYADATQNGKGDLDMAAVWLQLKESARD